MIDTRLQRDCEFLVDLDALAHNFRVLRANAGNSECAAVVKADAYGLGMPQVALRLRQEGCRIFFVATVREGMALREHIPDQTVYVFEGPTPGAETLFLSHQLTPVLNSLPQARRWMALVSNRAPADRPATALHIDTGMTRLGLSADDVRILAGETDLANVIKASLIMTHLACADTPDHPKNARQIECFNALRALLPEARTSIGNSTITELQTGFHGDVVRPGIGLYGGNPVANQPNPFRPVVSWRAPVLQVRDLDEAASIGYGASRTMKPPARIATVAAGYADGYLRSLGHRGVVSVNSQRAPVVGRISMDMITVDVSGLAPGALREGDWVELLGAAIGLDELANLAGTIGYEILTSAGSRAMRSYRGEADTRPAPAASLQRGP